MSSRIIRRAFPQFPVAQLGPNPVNGKVAGMGGAPVAFSAQKLAMTPGTAGAVLNAQTLQSGFRTPYVIDEIRISAQTSVHASALITPYRFTALAALLSAKFETGKHAFSKDAVPVGMYAPYFSNYDYGTVFAANGYRDFLNVRWMLPKPLYMPAGDVVQAYVSLGANGAMTDLAVTVDVTITYIGRLVAPGAKQPATRQIPWVGYMNTDAASGSAAGSIFKTSSREFENPFMIDMHVQRFTARTFAYTSTSYIETPYAYQLYSSTIPFFETQIDDSLGYQIVPEFVPVGEAFDTSRHAWTFGRPLGARQQFNVQVRTGLNSVTTDRQISQQIGFVGYREENT